MWFLKQLAGDTLERAYLYTRPFRVGRLEGVNLVLRNDSASDTHAEVFDTEYALRVRDLGSENGTFVNGARVADAPIREGDHLRFGAVAFMFRWDQRHAPRSCDLLAREERIRKIGAEFRNDPSILAHRLETRVRMMSAYLEALGERVDSPWRRDPIMRVMMNARWALANDEDTVEVLSSCLDAVDSGLRLLEDGSRGHIPIPWEGELVGILDTTTRFADEFHCGVYSKTPGLWTPLKWGCT